MQDEYPLTPVPQSNHRTWWSVAAISSLVSLSLPTFLTGIEVGRSMVWADAVMAIYLGSIILAAIGGIAATLGVRYRLTSYALIHLSFGGNAARLVNLAFGLSLVGWFGVNVDLFSEAVLDLIQPSQTSASLILMIEISAGLLITLSTLLGFIWINRLSLIFTPILMVVTALLLRVWLEGDASITPMPADSLTFSEAVSAVVGAAVVGAVILPDITRYVREAYGGWLVSFACYFLVAPLVMVIAAGAMSVLQTDSLLTLMTLSGLGVGAALIVVLGSWVLNSLNLYSAVLTIRASIPESRQMGTTLCLGVLGIAAAAMNITTWFIDFLIYLSIAFIPIAGIMLVHFYTALQPVPQDALTPSAIEGSKSNSQAIIAWVASLAVALAEMQTAITLSGVMSIDLLAFSAAFYYALRRLA